MWSVLEPLLLLVSHNSGTLKMHSFPTKINQLLVYINHNETPPDDGRLTWNLEAENGSGASELRLRLGIAKTL